MLRRHFIPALVALGFVKAEAQAPGASATDHVHEWVSFATIEDKTNTVGVLNRPLEICKYPRCGIVRCAQWLQSQGIPTD